jgi:hypothetical protein
MEEAGSDDLVDGFREEDAEDEGEASPVDQGNTIL